MTVPFVPPYAPLEVLVGVAEMWVQPYVAGTPPTLPPNTLALNGAWPAPWEGVGASHEGLSFEFERKVNEISIEEQPNPVAYLTETLTIQAVVTLAQDSLKTMRLAYGGGVVTTVAAGVGVYGTKTLAISPTLELMAFGFESFNELGKPRRVLLPTVVSVGNIKTEYRRAAEKRMYETAFKYTGKPADVIILDITASPTS